jgi:hypothetical protein
MRRREFITLIGAAAAWPLSAPAQQPAAMPVIGYFSSQSAIWDVARLTAWRRALAEAGYVEGTNLTIEYRWTDGDYDRLAPQAAEFVHRRVAVIFASLRVSIREIALATLIHQRRLTPSCGGRAPYRGENSGPGKDSRGELDTQTRN